MAEATVFISYSSTDRIYAEKLFASLEERGITAWMYRDLEYGANWIEEIEKKIDTCAAFIIIMTTSSKKTDWVKNELRHAIHKDRAIFPILLEGDSPWIEVNGYQCFVDYKGELPPESFYKQLVAKVGIPYVLSPISGRTKQQVFRYFRLVGFLGSLLVLLFLIYRYIERSNNELSAITQENEMIDSVRNDPGTIPAKDNDRLESIVGQGEESKPVNEEDSPSSEQKPHNLQPIEVHVPPNLFGSSVYIDDVLVGVIPNMLSREPFVRRISLGAQTVQIVKIDSIYRERWICTKDIPEDNLGHAIIPEPIIVRINRAECTQDRF